tara:strand:- start:3724 stop:3966 length:243 start_codon:yes stop_codon:yes gene_type:complete
MQENKTTRKELRENYGKYYTNMQIKNQIDMRLEKMTSIECKTGVDSTPAELKKADKEKKILLLEIKKIDPVYYEKLSLAF